MFRDLLAMSGGIGRLMDRDALIAVASEAAQTQLEPIAAAFLADIRTKLLARVTGDVPPTLGPALARRGMALPPAAQATLWAAFVDAIASDDPDHAPEPILAPVAQVVA